MRLDFLSFTGLSPTVYVNSLGFSQLCGGTILDLPRLNPNRLFHLDSRPYGESLRVTERGGGFLARKEIYLRVYLT